MKYHNLYIDFEGGWETYHAISQILEKTPVEYTPTPGKSSEKYKTFTQGSFREYRAIDTIHTIEIEKHIADLNFDTKEDTPILENLRDLAGDPHLYSIVRIILSTKDEYVMKNVAGFRIDQKAELAVKNRVNSEYILIPETGQPLTVLCIWDFPYPDCSDKFEMLSLQKDGFKSLCSENLGVNKREWEKEKKQFMLKVSRNCGSEEDKAVININ